MSAARHKLSVALIDVDYFKSINDIQGHAAGDAALREVAETISTHLRGRDHLGRYGGDEFLLILPGTPVGVALGVTDRLNKAVSDRTGAGNSMPLTLSIGLTEAVADDDAVTLIARADKALYQAKATAATAAASSPPAASPKRPTPCRSRWRSAMSSCLRLARAFSTEPPAALLHLAPWRLAPHSAAILTLGISTHRGAWIDRSQGQSGRRLRPGQQTQHRLRLAQKLAEAGATLVLSYQSDRLRGEAEELLKDLGQSATGKAFQCDVSRDEEIDALFQNISLAFPKIDILIHSVAFAPADAIKNDFLLTKREDFRIAHDVSVYSLIAVARAAAPLMTEGGAMLTLTYYGSEKVFPNYNVMGVAKAALEATVRYLAASLGPKNIRVNAVSAGPIKTLAARGIGDFCQHPRYRHPTRAAAPQRRADRGRQHCALPLLAARQRHHRRDHLRRLRLQHHRNLAKRGTP